MPLKRRVHEMDCTHYLVLKFISYFLLFYQPTILSIIISFVLCFLWMLSFLLKAKLFYNQGRSVRPYVSHRELSLFVNLNRLELSYWFQTLHDDSCSSSVQFWKRSNSITNTRMSVRAFETCRFLTFLTTNFCMLKLYDSSDF